MTADAIAHVEPGGPAAVRHVTVGTTPVEVRKLSVGPMDNNVYLLTDTQRGDGLLIDAANDAGRILDEVGQTRLAAIVTTHGHHDHWQALEEVVTATRAPVYAHQADSDMLPRPPDSRVVDGTAVTFGDAEVKLLHTPGHTPGSVCVLLEGGEHPYLFSGDTLFPGGPGNTFGDEQAFATIIASLRSRLFPLGDETVVCPGHGDGTTIGAERPHLDEWQARGW